MRSFETQPQEHMRSPAWRSNACSNRVAGALRASITVSALLLVALSATGATRPHYGGVLRVHLLSAISRLDGEDADRVLAAVGETLPVLASDSQHDAAFRKWHFRLKPRISFHDGSSLTAADAAESLNS